MNRRIACIDRTKALLIMLVVLGHVLNYANPGYDILPYTAVQIVISSFHMPAFFMLSGMLADEETWRHRDFRWLLRSRCRTLLVPYFFFESAAILYKRFVLHSVTLAEGLYRMITLRCNVGADWFLPAMFMACVFFWLYARCPGRYKWIPAVLLPVLLRQILPEGHGWDLVLRGVLGFAFFVTGAILKEKLSDIRMWKFFAAAGLTVCAALAAFKLGLDNDFYHCTLNGPVLFWISGCCGLYTVLSAAKVLSWKWLDRMGQDTLTIMGTHQLVQYTVSAGSSPAGVVGMLLLIAAVEIVLIHGLNRFFPILIGKKERSEGNGSTVQAADGA